MNEYASYIDQTYGKGLEKGFKLNKAVKLNERDLNIIYADVNKMEAIYQEEDNSDLEEKL